MHIKYNFLSQINVKQYILIFKEIPFKNIFLSLVCLKLNLKKNEVVISNHTLEEVLTMLTVVTLMCP